jgi:hypothetical protein
VLEQHRVQEAHRRFAATSEIDAAFSKTNDPQQGARLVRAFLRISDPRVRMAIVQMVEKMGHTSTAS